MAVDSVWNDAVVCITGGTGSLGQAFTRYALRELGVKTVRVISRDEFKQAEMAAGYAPEEREHLRFLLGDVRDRARLTRAFEGADVVLHAAALKRVDLLAHDPEEMLRTNVDGARNVMNAAIDTGVAVVVGVSTDKAAAPANIYGNTKASMEHLFAYAHTYVGPRRTRFCTTRYGNVLGSRGSVIPLWLATHARGEPIAVAPGVSRFWLTLETACEVVRWAAQSVGDSSQGGELFVPDLPRSWLSTMAAAACPGAAVYVAELRHGGEKRHETLLTEWERSAAVPWKSGLGWMLRPGAPCPAANEGSLRSCDAPLLDVAGCRALLERAGLLTPPPTPVAVDVH